MHADLGDFLLAITGVAGTLLGTFIVGVFFYLDLAHYRASASEATPKDRYMRAAVRWVFVAYSIPLLLPLVLVFADPLWGALTFVVLSTMLLAATVGTVRRIVTRGGAGSSFPLILNGSRPSRSSSRSPCRGSSPDGCRRPLRTSPPWSS